MGTKVRAESLVGDQLDAPSKQVLEEEHEPDEVIESLLSTFEADQEIHIALRSLLTSREGTKKPHVATPRARIRV